MGGVVKPIRIDVVVTAYCATCSKRLDVQLTKEGEDAMRQMHHLNSDFIVEYVRYIYGWYVAPDGRTWCKVHKADQSL